MHANRHASHASPIGPGPRPLRARRCFALLPVGLLALALSACGGSDGGEATEPDPVVLSAGAVSSNVVNTNVIPAAGVVPGKVVDSNVIPVPAAVPVKPEAAPAAAAGTDWIDTLVGDMRLFHDGPSAALGSTADGGLGAGWPEARPRPSGWAHARARTHTMADMAHASGGDHPWRVPGPYTGNQAPNTRVQQRDIQIWWLLSDGKWVLGSHHARPSDLMLPLDQAGGTEKAGTDIWRDESANGGGASMRSIGREGYARHMWREASGSSPVPANAVGAVGAFFSRLILDDPNGPDDRDKAHVLSACAGDWLAERASLDAREPQRQNALRMGFGRLKYVTRQWQLFGWTNLSEAQIRANPPPLIGLPK